MLEELLQKNRDKVVALLNILMESPYFYRTDAEELFLYLRRYRREFAEFYREYYGWELIIDEKCARVYKEKWYNDAITPGTRLQFTLNRRDESLAFMLLIEFFEHQLEENAITAEDPQNLCFTCGDWLEFLQRRFIELFPQGSDKYTAEYLRSTILRSLIPKLIKYRFIRELPKPQGMELSHDQFIYEALPALYHYNGARLGESIASEPLVFTATTPAEDQIPEEEEDGTYTETAADATTDNAPIDGLIQELSEEQHAQQ